MRARERIGLVLVTVDLRSWPSPRKKRDSECEKRHCSVPLFDEDASDRRDLCPDRAPVAVDRPYGTGAPAKPECHNYEDRDERAEFVFVERPSLPPVDVQCGNQCPEKEDAIECQIFAPAQYKEFNCFV